MNPNDAPMAETIEIRIRPDGQIYLHGADPELWSVVADLCPNDAWLARRLARLAPPVTPKESQHAALAEDP